MQDQESNRAYQERPPRKGLGHWKWIIPLVLLGVGLMGACVLSFGGMMKNATERQGVTRLIIEEFTADGIPAFDDPRFAKEMGATAEQFEKLRKYAGHFGVPTKIEDATCMAKTQTTTNGLSGQFVMCTSAVTYPATSGRIEMTWWKRDEDWKILRYYIHFDDISSLLEAAEEKEETPPE